MPPLTWRGCDRRILDLDRLRSRRMTGSEYQLFVTEAETRVQAAFSAEASRFGIARVARSATIRRSLPDVIVKF